MTKPICFIIEDNEELGDIFSHALRLEEYDVELIPDGNDAIGRLGEVVPHLVLLDMFLPGKNGEHILNHIRSDARLKETRVVVVTAYPQAARFLSAKPDTVLSKPIRLNQLRHMVARYHPRAASTTETNS